MSLAVASPIEPATTPARSRPGAGRASLLRQVQMVGLFLAGGYTFAGQIKVVAPFSSSPIDVTLLFVAGTVACAAAFSVLSRKLRIKVRALAVWAGLVMIAVGGTVNRIDTDYGLEKERILLYLTLPVALAAGLLIRHRNDFLVLVFSSAGWGVFLAVSTFLSDNRDRNGRLIAAEGGTISFSRASCIALVVVAGWLIAGNRQRFAARLPWVLVLAGFQLYVVLAIASRGPIQALMLAVIVMLGIQTVVMSRKRIIRSATVVAIAVTAGSALLALVPEGSRERLGTLFTGTSVTEQTSRPFLWRWTLERAGFEPVGRGWGRWSDDAQIRTPAVSEYELVAYPHTIQLEIWYEAGFLFMIVFVVMAASILWIHFRQLQLDQFHATVTLGVLVFWLGAAQFSGDLNDNRSLLALLVAAAAVPRLQRAPTGESGPGVGTGADAPVIDLRNDVTLVPVGGPQPSSERSGSAGVNDGVVNGEAGVFGRRPQP